MNKEMLAAKKVLQQGGLILYPTDTIWGIGCDATNENAVQKIYELKERSDEKSMIILLDDIIQLEYYVKEVPEIAYKLIEVTDKPLTIIFDDAQNLATNLIARDGSVAIRIVKSEFCQQLIKAFGKPIVSTSANVSGQKWPSSFKEINTSIICKVDHVVSRGLETQNQSKPSGIIQLKNTGEVKVIRE